MWGRMPGRGSFGKDKGHENRGEAHPRPRRCLLVLLPFVAQTQTGGSRHKVQGKGKALLPTMYPLVFPRQGTPCHLQN